MKCITNDLSEFIEEQMTLSNTIEEQKKIHNDFEFTKALRTIDFLLETRTYADFDILDCSLGNHLIKFEKQEAEKTLINTYDESSVSGLNAFPWAIRLYFDHNVFVHDILYGGISSIEIKEINYKQYFVRIVDEKAIYEIKLYD